jgi:hypothetical protein
LVVRVRSTTQVGGADFKDVPGGKPEWWGCMRASAYLQASRKGLSGKAKAKTGIVLANIIAKIGDPFPKRSNKHADIAISVFNRTALRKVSTTATEMEQ